MVLRQQTNLIRVSLHFLLSSTTHYNLHFARRLILRIKKCFIGIPPILLHQGLDHLPKRARSVGTLTSHKLCLREDSDSQLPIFFQGIIDGHVQTAEHDGEETSGAGTPDHVENLAWLGSGSKVVLTLDLEHDIFEDKELAEGCYTAAIYDF